MLTPVKASQTVKEGLRYKAKVPGAPSGETNQYAYTATMAFFLCGKHRLRTQPLTCKLLGNAQNVCSPKCKK